MGNQQPKEILMQKITQERFEEKVATRFPEERFTIISYSSQGKPLKIRCDNCGKIINVKVAGNFLAKHMDVLIATGYGKKEKKRGKR